MDLTSVDVSLDEVIKMQKAKNVGVQRKQKPKKGGAGYKKGANKIEIKRQPQAVRIPQPVKQVIQNSPKILIANLAASVSAGDLEELFSGVGELQSYPIMHHDSRGKPLGSAEVTFQMRGDARKALEKYNGITLDGKPLRIQFTLSGEGGGMAGRLVGLPRATSSLPALMQQPVTQQRPNRTVIAPKHEVRGFNGLGFNAGNGPNRQRGGGTVGSGNGGGDWRKMKKKEDKAIDPGVLDAEMDSYMAKHPGTAMSSQ